MGGSGYYLGMDEILSWMEKDYVYLLFGDCILFKEWVEVGKLDLNKKVIEWKEEIFVKLFKVVFFLELDVEFCSVFKIYLLL